VILDALSLGTLPRPRISEGLIEAYKTGLVQDPSLAELIETHHRALMAKDRLLLFQLTARSARAKAVVVSEDFTEKGKRAILNFGHTYGHAVEGFHQYRVSHGRAVALGLAAATRLSLNRGLIPSDTADRILKTISRLAPNPPDLPPLADAWEIMLGDKKIRAGRLVFVLLEGPGRPLLVNDVTRVELDRAARELAGDR
jgi:3-dehydroquinate synthetase